MVTMTNQQSKFSRKDRMFGQVTVDDPRFSSMKRRFDELKGRKEEKEDQLETARGVRKTLSARLENAKKAQALVQLVVKEIQESLQHNISYIVTLAESAVFDDPYDFVVRFEPRRGVTECDLLFSKDGQEMNPIRSSGGGAIDVAALALNCSFLILEGREPVLILDEPFHNINDPTRELHRKAAEMLKEVSTRLGIQMIIVTGLTEITGVADKVFEVSMSGGVSTVKEGG